MRINQNIMANNAYRNLSTTNMSLGKSLEKLSSGFRINRAADDAAGLVISQNLRAQTSGLRQATRNAQDGISVVQTAEGALNEVHTMLNRMRDLAVQAANTGANDPAARSAAQAEITAMTSEINRISESTAFGGTKLLDGSYGRQLTTAAATNVSAPVVGAATVDVGLVTGIAVGTFTATTTATEARDALILAVNSVSGTTGITAIAGNAAGNAIGAISYVNTNAAAVTVAVVGMTGGGQAAAAATAPVKQFQIGANSADTLNLAIGTVSTSGLGSLNLNSVSVLTEANASLAISSLDGAISRVSTQRGSLGAVQNRFESMINNLQVTTENLVASESRIRDTDMAAEMTNFTKNQILSQAGTAMLAQANQVPQSILSLLR